MKAGLSRAVTHEVAKADQRFLLAPPDLDHSTLRSPSNSAIFRYEIFPELLATAKLPSPYIRWLSWVK